MIVNYYFITEICTDLITLTTIDFLFELKVRFKDFIYVNETKFNILYYFDGYKSKRFKNRILIKLNRFKKIKQISAEFTLHSFVNFD